MANIRDVAKEAKVSVATVSRVINGGKNVSPKTKNKVLKAIRKLNYKPKISYRKASTGIYKTLAFLVPDLRTYHYGEILMGVESCATENGFDVLVSITGLNPEFEKRTLSDLFERKIDGIILSELFIEKETLEKFKEIGIPIVIIDFKHDEIFMDSVNSDNVSGGYHAIKFLYDNGHRKILHIPGPEWSPAAQDRIKGIKKFLSKHKDVEVKFSEIKGYEPEIGRKAIREYLNKYGLDFTAIFSVNDWTAVAIIDELKNNGIKVPDDVSIIGFDDAPIAKYLTPNLTTVKQHRWEMGYTGTQLLIERITSGKSKLPRNILIPTDLVIRDSVKKIL